MEENPKVAFKCLHYSVTESAGTVKITILKKEKGVQQRVGVRTIEGTAKNERDYDEIDQIVTLKPNMDEITIDIRIHDDDEWNPDYDFYVELYDVTTKRRLSGDDTQCKVTILDEDFPGKLSFKKTDMLGSRKNKQIDVVVERTDGTDGAISCHIRTEALILGQQNAKNSENAQPFLDYVPIDEKLEFAAGENQKIIKIELIDNGEVSDDPELEMNIGLISSGVNASMNGSESQASTVSRKKKKKEDLDDFGPKFKVIIEKAEPAGVKISKKNCCTVEIKDGYLDEVQEEEQINLIKYYVAQKNNNSWSQQFVDACMLSPVVDDDDLVVEQPGMSDALTHFATMFWKILFAFIPPVRWGGGKPAFVIALCFIGSVTAVVAEVATVLGCTVGLKEAVTAITLVAIGTSLPDTFASMTAARNSETADSAIGNVTGSNSVNVFVGLGIPWVISSVYAENRN